MAAVVLLLLILSPHITCQSVMTSSYVTEPVPLLTTYTLSSIEDGPLTPLSSPYLSPSSPSPAPHLSPSSPSPSPSPAPSSSTM